MALADGLDDQILSGSSGLLTGTILANHNVSAVTDFGGYLKELAYARVDGTYAAGTSELRVVVGAGTYAHAGSVYRTTEGDSRYWIGSWRSPGA